MKREIKFRAWHKESKVMLYDKPSNVFKWLDEGQPIELMQFTGLKDKNGVEIYEGDILKWRCSKSGSKKERYYIVTIEWVNNAHGYSLTIHDNGEKWGTQKSYWNAHEREVIGNIYENPELLK